MKTVCKQVYAKYPDFDLTDKKDFIKATVKAVSELPWHSPNIIIHYFAFLSVNCDIDYAETKALVKPGGGSRSCRQTKTHKTNGDIKVSTLFAALFKNCRDRTTFGVIAKRVTLSSCPISI